MDLSGLQNGVLPFNAHQQSFFKLHIFTRITSEWFMCCNDFTQ